jgi:hypothetical protein
MARLSTDEKNRRTSARQLRRLKTAREDVLYLSSDGRLITTWIGEVAGYVTHLRKRPSPIGGGFYNLRFRSVHGHSWSGTSPGPGMYARVRRMKG